MHSYIHKYIPIYIHTYIYICPPTNIHDFSISRFPDLHNAGISISPEIWKTILIYHNYFGLAELSSYFLPI